MTTGRIPAIGFVLVAAMLVQGALGAPPETPASAPAKPSQVGVLFDIERSGKEDVIYFRNKDVLRGTVLNEALTISTQYGQLTVPVRRCAGLSFEGARANTEALVTVNFNRITGIVTDRVINFKISTSGETIQIRKEKVRFVLLQRTPEETDFLTKALKSDLFLMANGDILTGEAVERKIIIRTDYAKVPVAFDEMAKVEMQGGENVTAVIAKTNGDVMRGTLGTNEMTLVLDIGVKVDEVYKDKFGAIYVDQALALAPTIFGTQQPVIGESGGALATTGVVGGQQVLTLDMGNELTKMKLVLIPAGKFVMGSPGTETGRSDDEGPQRTVTISKPYFMGVTEVTQEQYEAVMGNNPAKFRGPTCPVEQVSWDDAVAFCEKLSKKTGKKVMLPTEAQCEYACRAGSKTRFGFGEDDKKLGEHAWFSGNSDSKTHPVAEKKANAWGLHDMHGNVWEWCSDRYGTYTDAPRNDPVGPEKGDNRVLRGGGWYGTPAYCRSAYRRRFHPDDRRDDYGFRVAVLAAGVD